GTWNTLTWNSHRCPSFQGLVFNNGTERLGLDYQRMIRIQHMLYIAARDHVFVVNLTTAVDKIIPQQILTWRSTDVSKCAVRGRNSDECYNYIKVLVPRNDETLFACGTNALNPACRNYRLRTLEQVGQELLGQARCPFESRQSNVGVFAGGHFYSATVTDFQASDAVIYRSLGGEGRPVLRTVKYDSKWLREPHFLHAVEYGNYVYFFFSEIAVEHTGAGKVVYSRVARVCKNDSGGSSRVLDRHWTSFLKARLNCSVPGDTFFYFDVLQSLTSVLQINQRPAVVGVFTTQTNSIPGSAVCGFYLDDIERVFNGKFKEQKNSDSVWTPVPEEHVPEPRPGSCAGEGSASSYSSSVQFPDSVLSFIKTHPLMDESVSAINSQPLITSTAKRTVLGLELDKEHHALFVAFSSCIIRVPLSRCAQHTTCKRRCLHTHDPYCIWLRTGRCADVAPGFNNPDLFYICVWSDVMSAAGSDVNSAVDSASGQCLTH
uniref:Sema domain, transmembrane domain (TM), and cytoplasmic domain, (semaphorin) 6D n=1 Tax=Cyprinus carpio TaxID=7962 RepID=A0A8C1PID9_CYPCA